MPELLKNFRGTIDWSDLSKTVQKCADEAMNKRKVAVYSVRREFARDETKVFSFEFLYIRKAD